MQVIEAFSRSRHSDDSRNEDGWVVTPFFAAVIDGEACEGASFPGGTSAAQFAKDTLRRALQSLPSTATKLGAVGHLTRALARQYKQAAKWDELEAFPERRPSASLVIYSRRRRELWMIGRGQVCINEQHHRIEELGTAFIVSMRGLILKNLLAKGTSREELRNEVPLRQSEAFQHMLKTHARWRNNATSGRYQYLGVDGFFLPAPLVTVLPVPYKSEVTLATDGYPWLGPSLEATEAKLKTLLPKDPLCVGELRALSAWRPEQDSYDDRTYLRLQTD